MTSRATADYLPSAERSRQTSGLLALSLLCILIAAAPCVAQPVIPPEWQFYQELSINQSGLVKIQLPPETIGASKMSLADLRLVGTNSQENPFQVENPAPPAVQNLPGQNFSRVTQGNNTVLQAETDSALPIRSIEISTPEKSFIKSVTVQASNDRVSWITLAQSTPVYRREDAEDLRLSFEPVSSRFFRLLVDDSRSAAIPFQGVTFQTAPQEVAPPRLLAARIVERRETAPDTRLALDLGNPNLFIAHVEVIVPEPFFSRRVSALTPAVRQHQMVEERVGSGVLSKIESTGMRKENLQIAIEQRVASRRLILVIENGNAPPLQIQEARVFYRPEAIVFHSTAGVPLYLLCGNPVASAPRYDAPLSTSSLAKLKPADATFGPLKENPSYRPPEVLPGVAESGAPLDLQGWQYRKKIHVQSAGPQRCELDPEILSLAAPDLRDLRLVQNQKQFPYLLERTATLREISPVWNPAADPRKASVSAWKIQLPRPGLPVARLLIRVETPLFQRSVSLFEIEPRTRNGSERRQIGQALWIRKSDETNGLYVLQLTARPESDQLLLETDNGDNPPIVISDIKAAYPLSYLHFKAGREPDYALYFGNEEAQAPVYDLVLAGAALLEQNSTAATLAELESLKAGANRFWAGQTNAVYFWAILVAVLGILIFLIARLLPKTGSPS